MKVLQKIDWKIFVSSLVLGVLVTALFAKLPFISRVTMMWLDLIVINGGYCILVARHYHQTARPWGILMFPIIYLVGGYFFTPRYMWYFAIIYLGVSYLAWSMSRTQQ